ncbi:hypothetical protein M885DRAFT_517196 [Pelagophyceae sp. CCMP2097]|nr:hypothetical protein M885DRAFT_517196 [Pelagophyceae sp. CCMP2097]
MVHLTLVAALVLSRCSGLVGPPRHVHQRRGGALGMMLVDPTEAIQAGLEAMKIAHTTTEAYDAMARIYESLPRDDIALNEAVVLDREFKVEVFREISARRNDAELWTDPQTIELFKAIRADFDPFRSVDLGPYLSVAGFFGGFLYLVALAVQAALPEIFQFVYVVLVLAFAAPFVWAFFLA